MARRKESASSDGDVQALRDALQTLAADGTVEYLGEKGLERLCSVVKDALVCATDEEIDALFD